MSRSILVPISVIPPGPAHGILFRLIKRELPGQGSNLELQLQRLTCYRYTTGQCTEGNMTAEESLTTNLPWANSLPENRGVSELTPTVFQQVPASGPIDH